MPARYSAGIIKAVNTILSYIIDGLRSIVLLGRCARLNIHVGSDIDLLVVTKDHIIDRMLKSEITAPVLSRLGAVNAIIGG